MRQAPPAPSQFAWITEHDLRFADMDRMGHVNNGAFISLIESNRTALLFSEAMVRAGALAFVLARFEIDYYAELRWPGRVTATSGVEAMGRTSLRLRQALFLGGACVAAARAVIVAVNPRTHRPSPIPQAVRDVLAGWMMREPPAVEAGDDRPAACPSEIHVVRAMRRGHREATSPRVLTHSRKM